MNKIRILTKRSKLLLNKSQINTGTENYNYRIEKLIKELQQQTNRQEKELANTKKGHFKFPSVKSKKNRERRKVKQD